MTHVPSKDAASSEFLEFWYNILTVELLLSVHGNLQSTRMQTRFTAAFSLSSVFISHGLIRPSFARTCTFGDNRTKHDMRNLSAQEFSGLKQNWYRSTQNGPQ